MPCWRMHWAAACSAPARAGPELPVPGWPVPLPLPSASDGTTDALLAPPEPQAASDAATMTANTAATGPGVGFMDCSSLGCLRPGHDLFYGAGGDTGATPEGACDLRLLGG